MASPFKFACVFPTHKQNKKNKQTNKQTKTKQKQTIPDIFFLHQIDLLQTFCNYFTIKVLIHLGKTEMNYPAMENN